MLKEKIQSDLNQALKKKDATRVSTLRFLLAEVHNREIELYQKLQGKSLPDEEVVEVLRRQVKRRKESIEAYKQGKRDDLVKKEEAELGILNKYLPQQLSPEELEKIVEKTIAEVDASEPQDFGKVMVAVMGKVKGQAKGEIVAKLVREVLTSSG